MLKGNDTLVRYVHTQQMKTSVICEMVMSDSSNSYCVIFLEKFLYFSMAIRYCSNVIKILISAFSGNIILFLNEKCAFVKGLL